MAITTNVPPPSLTSTGFVIPTDDAILAGVLADMNSAFGGNMNTTNLETPQGQLASSLAAIIANADQTFMYYTTQVDPAFAEGRMQDAIARIYFLQRLPATQTTVTCTCTGAAGTLIPTGALAQDTSGNNYLCTSGGTIPISGTISLVFANTIVGPIPCPENTVTTIYQAIPGWDTITNPFDGVIGSNEESRAAFETRRQQSVAQNSVNTVQSVLGAVLNVPGVIDAYVTENYTASPVTVGGVTLAAHSLYVCVSGGTNQAVAQAIWSKKPPGCAYNGNTTVTVLDTNYNLPYPTYSVTFEIPDPLEFYFSVTLYNNVNIPSNATALIQAAIVNAFAGADGGPRPRIGSNVLASRFYAPIAALGSWAQIQSLFIGSVNVPGAVGAGTISGSTLTVTDVNSGTIAIGQFVQDFSGRISAGTYITAGSGTSWTLNNTQTVTGASFTGVIAGTTLTTSAVTGFIGADDFVTGSGVPAHTYIVAQLTGATGGAGTYQLSNSATVASEAMTSSPGITFVPANALNVQANINQIPVVADQNIVVATSSV